MNEKTNINELIKQRFAELPPEVQRAVTDVNLGDKIQVIVKNNGLLYDQASSLYREVILTMLGFQPSSDFVDNLVSELEIDSGKATKIANEVSSAIFTPIKRHLQEWEEEAKVEQGGEFNTPIASSPIQANNLQEKEPENKPLLAEPPKELSSLERLGNFEINKVDAGTYGNYGNISNGNNSVEKATDYKNIKGDIEKVGGVTGVNMESGIENKADILKGIEYPETIKKISEPPVNLPTQENPPLAKTGTQPNTTQTIPPVKTEPKQVVTPSSPNKDPYREPIE